MRYAFQFRGIAVCKLFLCVDGVACSGLEFFYIVETFTKHLVGGVLHKVAGEDAGYGVFVVHVLYPVFGFVVSTSDGLAFLAA